MIHFASVNLKNWVAVYLCSLKIRYWHPDSSETVHRQNKNRKKKKIYSFCFYVSDIPELLSYQLEEHQAATLPGEEQWSGGMMCWTGTPWLPIRKNTTHIMRKVQSKRSIWALYNPFTHTSIFKTLSSFMWISRKNCFSQATDSLRKQQLKSVIHILSLSLQGFLFLPVSTKLTAMQGFAFMIEHCREQRADSQLSVLSQNHRMVGLERTSGGHLVWGPSKGGSARAGCTGSYPGRFLISPEKDTSEPLWAACSSDSQSKEDFPYIQTEFPMFQVMPIALFQVAGLHWQVSVPILLEWWSLLR